MGRVVFYAALMLMLCAAGWTASGPMQITTTSWPGLSGLFIMPTARIIGEGKLAVGFNESKHTEYINNGKYTDRQIRGVATYGISNRLEIYGAYWNDMYTIPPGIQPQLHNHTFQSFGLKYMIMPEDRHYWFPAVAVAIRDIGNQVDNAGPLEDVYNGRKFFLIVSKRLLRDERIGRFMDVHAALTFDENVTAGELGFELTLAPNASLIAEGIYDSPYLNFHNFGDNDREGRFLFNTGVRIYPELVPGLVLDLGFIGDSEFEFSFGTSYIISF